MTDEAAALEGRFPPTDRGSGGQFENHPTGVIQPWPSFISPENRGRRTGNRTRKNPLPHPAPPPPIPKTPDARIGHGFDVHAFRAGRIHHPGGVRIPHARGLVAHSDGDVLLHALCDALLGAAGLATSAATFPIAARVRATTAGFCCDR